MIHKNHLSLEEYIAHPDARNLQAQFLNGKSLKDFHFIGITERYSESIELFNAIFNSHLKSHHFENVNEKKEEQYDVPFALRDAILKYNDLDNELYQYALCRFDLKIKEHAISKREK
ncbi:MAG: hypothetical protein EOM11_10280 [Erysipelotrichia bacterium]|nr:hypothetical protein [Erysipelotrichia bacterium]